MVTQDQYAERSAAARDNLPDNEPDAVPQPDQILGNASRTLTLMDHRIETVRKQLAELEGQREAYVRDLRKLGEGD